jgi:hypothetical protein
MLFSVVPNSMADERTVSGVTFVNTALRNRQKVSTIVDQLQVRQYYGFKEKVRGKAILQLIDLADLLFKALADPRSKRPALRFSALKDYRRTQYISDFENSGGDEDISDDDSNGDDEETQSDAADLDEDQALAHGPFALGKFSKPLEHINMTSPILSKLLSDTPGAAGKAVSGIAESRSHSQVVPPVSKDDDDEYPALWV